MLTPNNPRNHGETRQFNMRLSEEAHDRINILCDKLNMTKRELMELLVHQEFEAQVQNVS